MNKKELNERGQRNIIDARFIRDQILPLAQSKQRWNIVVFEAYRATELFVKGMICLCGYTPRETHDIDILVNKFNGILFDTRKSLPFTYSWIDGSHTGYGVEVTGEEIYFFETSRGSYQALASGIPSQEFSDNELLQMRLELVNNTVNLYVGDQLQFSSTASLLPSSWRLEQKIERHPEFDRLLALKDAANKLIDAGNKLLADREDAFFSVREYLEQEAIAAISRMEIALEASKHLFNLEIDTSSFGTT